MPRGPPIHVAKVGPALNARQCRRHPLYSSLDRTTQNRQRSESTRDSASVCKIRRLSRVLMENIRVSGLDLSLNPGNANRSTFLRESASAILANLKAANAARNLAR